MVMVVEDEEQEEVQEEEKQEVDVNGGAVAHLAEQLATKSDVRSSNPCPGPANFSLLLCVHPALNGQLGLLRPGESKGAEESNVKLPHNAVCQEQSGP
ncbi:hypothetical protein PoB_001511200 [Plakobranchus ocellatus]|uniref:Uncharacterized protein n=1 Tax=Plakobranchus ocellatus TaxID=259542 RepID=A0AAV3Z074_9GAST|nr:hypothetical protein PoB_001511200 [Plakobranchus ocellatus]